MCDVGLNFFIILQMSAAHPALPNNCQDGIQVLVFKAGLSNYMPA
jgi:hypothetical protein